MTRANRAFSGGFNLLFTGLGIAGPHPLGGAVFFLLDHHHHCRSGIDHIIVQLYMVAGITAALARQRLKYRLGYLCAGLR